ncbi:MAG: restriction endonuclease subunit S [Diaphorobacter nitroreducens]|uniref:restriction endonuclease subunit S n=1 Tax=Diaphorobacter TaxID=238749 RepID=UPI0028965547|nr:restriction endonuclease subunit S [Diaphorobacter sp.]
MGPTDALPHPADWKTAVVGRCVDIRRGVSWSKDQEHTAPYEGAVPVIGISNVQDRLLLDKVLYLSGLKPRAIEKKRIEQGWSVLVGSNGNRQRIGNAVYIAEDAAFLFASFLLAAKPRADSGITPEFFFRWLRSEQVQSYLSASSEGSTGLSNLSHSFFRKMTMAFPGQTEQVAIARVLAAVDAAIDRAQEAVGAACEVQASVIQSLVATCVSTSKSYALGDLILEGPTNGLYRPESDYGVKGTPIVRIDSFANGSITNLPGLRRVVVPSVIRERFALKQGDVLINRVNALTHVGKAAVVPEISEPTLFESNMMRLRCVETLVPEYLGVILRSDIARRHWLARSKPAVNQVSVNQRDTKSLCLPLPDPDRQREIAKAVHAADALVLRCQDRISTLQSLKKSLMHDLLTGTVRVDPAIVQEQQA